MDEGSKPHREAGTDFAVREVVVVVGFNLPCPEVVLLFPLVLVVLQGRGCFLPSESPFGPVGLP